LDATSWSICKRIYQRNDIKRFDEIEGLSINRGEINQTIYRRFITKDPSHTRLLKGVEVGAFRVNSRLSQGEREWLDRARYEEKFAAPGRVTRPRIATQRITGVDETYRLVACLTEPGWFFADSTNSIDLHPNCAYCREYVLALLNSKVLQWRFKITSTNNNVGTNELSALPFREIDVSAREDSASYRRIVGLARNACKYASQADSAASRKDRLEASIWLERLRDEIDKELYVLYGITDQERPLIESWVARKAVSRAPSFADLAS
jgi:hypothetical protein